jgi:hypothetical protein
VYTYRTPGVYFEWLDPPAGIGPLRTDIAGFVGVAARGPLNQPVKVESMTQFTSTFGDQIPQGYLAYAVRGFFANGGATCYVVRVADPNQAQSASLVLADTAGEGTLLLKARSPGVWGRQVRVGLTNIGAERFSLTLQIPGRGQELWQDLTMALAHLLLVDQAGRPTLRLTAFDPRTWGTDVRAMAVTDRQGGLSLTFTRVNGQIEEQWTNLSLDPAQDNYVVTKLNDPQNGSRLVQATDLRPMNQRAPSKPPIPAIQLTVAAGGGEREARFTPEPRYVETVLNDDASGSRLVTATNLLSPTRFPDNTPVRPPVSPATAWYPLQAGQKVDLLDENQRPVLQLTADTSLQDLTGVTVMRGAGERFSIALSERGAPFQRQWVDLTLSPGQEGSAEAVLNRAGSVLRADRPGGLLPFPARGPFALQGGQDGLKTLTPLHISQGLDELRKVDEVSILAIPDLMFQQPPPPQFRPMRLCTFPEAEDDLPAPEGEIEYPPSLSPADIARLHWAMIAQCEDLKDRVAILDMPPGVSDVQAALAWRNAFDTKYAALYLPWLKVPDTLRLGGELLRQVPPSGHVAGVYARVDRRTGVHKPPANEVLEGVQDVTLSLDDIAHGMLNERAVNVIRPYPGRGMRVAGARTLSSDALWRYINVRRLLIMIEESIEEQLQWVVFENNHPDLWRELSRIVRSFLDDLWRRGMLDGATAEQAYTVTCDETTNPPVETDQGRLICQIGVLPPWPAEFVVVRIGKTEYGTQIIETQGNGNG